ncbi:MAG TPA: helix-turn-helix domain-containing protein [Thermoleophilaceae bacterium]
MTVAHIVRERRPAPALARHATCVWVQTVSPHSTAFTHRKAPNGSVELVCAVGSLPRILGPQTGPVEETLAAGTTIVGVRLRPEAASSVLGLPISSLVDLALEADELWGDPGAALQERVAGAGSAQGAAAQLERTVIERLADATTPDPVVAEGVRRLTSGRRAGVASMASSLFISERQLRRRFETATGLTPTTLHRILRFQRFLALAWTSERPSTQIGRLALEAGYHDQAHLGREAARLEGRSPRAFLAESEQRCGCGHDHSASYAPLLRHRSAEPQPGDRRAGRPAPTSVV